MAVKDILQAIAGKLGEDAPEVKALLAEAKREVDSLFSDLKAANDESKSRKDEIRKMKSQLDEVGDPADIQKQLKELKETLATKDAELAAVRKAEDDKIITAWKDKEKVLRVAPESKEFPKIEKIIADFTLTPEGGELTPEQAKANLERFNLIEKTGYFGESQATPTPNFKPAAPTDHGQPVYRSSGDAIAAALYKTK
jgi:hypothetical protein